MIPSFLPPVEQGAPDEALLRQLPAEPFILFVGGLLPQKGIWPLLGAYGRLRQPAPPLVSSGPRFYNSPNDLPAGVIELGAASHATVMAAWDHATLGVVPSVGAETFGNVVTEAMSHGRAVVASRLGGIVDIIEDGVSGLLVPPGDEDALATAMQRLLDDDGLRTAIGDAARVRVERFTTARVIPQFEAMYAELVARPARSRPGRRPRRGSMTDSSRNPRAPGPVRPRPLAQGRRFEPLPPGERRKPVRRDGLHRRVRRGLLGARDAHVPRLRRRSRGGSGVRDAPDRPVRDVRAGDAPDRRAVPARRLGAQPDLFGGDHLGPRGRRPGRGVHHRCQRARARAEGPQLIRRES